MLLLTLIGGCTPTASSRPPPAASTIDVPRPEGAPDIVIFLVSGHTLSGSTNQPYMDGAAQRLRAALRQRVGATVETRLYGDELYTWGSEAGFIELTNDMLEVALSWQLDPASGWTQEFDNPTRAVVVAHSHGAVWAHHAVETSPELLVDYLVDLDAVSVGWQQSYVGLGDEWAAEIGAFYEANGGNPWQHDVRGLDWVIEGGSANIKDIVSDNVIVNIEVKASPTLESTFGVNDTDGNVRWDGSTEGVQFVQSAWSHTALHEPDSDVMVLLEDLFVTVYAEVLSLP